MGGVVCRIFFGSYRVAVETVAIVAVLVAIRAVLWNLGDEAISTSPSPPASSPAGSCHGPGRGRRPVRLPRRRASPPTWPPGSMWSCAKPRPPTSTGHPRVWGVLRARLIAVVTSLRCDLNAGNTATARPPSRRRRIAVGVGGQPGPGQLCGPVAGRAGRAAQVVAGGRPHPARALPALGQGHDHHIVVVILALLVVTTMGGWPSR
jgi:hypothetical protein